MCEGSTYLDTKYLMARTPNAVDTSTLKLSTTPQICRALEFSERRGRRWRNACWRRSSARSCFRGLGSRAGWRGVDQEGAGSEAIPEAGRHQADMHHLRSAVATGGRRRRDPHELFCMLIRAAGRRPTRARGNRRFGASGRLLRALEEQPLELTQRLGAPDGPAVMLPHDTA